MNSDSKKRVMNTRIWTLVILIGAAEAASAVDYKKDVLPIMKEHCWDCHSNEKKVKGNLALDDLEEMGEYQISKFNIIRPHNPEESQFLQMLKLGEGDDDFMPRNGAAVPNAKIAVIEQWIKEGAIIDAENLTEKEKAVVSGEPAAPAENSKEKFLTWTNTEGKAIEARFVRIAGDAVTLLMKDGKSYNYPLAKLNEESQSQAKKLGGEE